MRKRIYVIISLLAVFICSEVVVDEVISLVEIPVINVPAAADGDTIAIFLTGDGGWRKIDKDIAATLSSKGIHVFGVNSMRYFWRKRTPEETANDIDILINTYLGRTGRKKAVLIGYSFGADVVPFVINRLSEKTRLKVSGAVLLGPAPDAFFEVSAKEWLGKIKGDYSTLPELLKNEAIPVLVFEGSKEDHTLINQLTKSNYEIVIIEGGHHFDGDYNKIALKISDWNMKNSVMNGRR